MFSMHCGRSGLLQPATGMGQGIGPPCRWSNCPHFQAHVRLPSNACRAYKKPSVVTPEDKALSSLVETGIRGSVSMAAAYALHLNLFSHIHLDLPSLITGLGFAAPCVAMEAALLLLSNALPSSTACGGLHPNPAPAEGSSTSVTTGVTAASLPVARAAVAAVYRHNLRYSLIRTGQPGERLALEVGAQLSDDLLARGVLLGCSTTWIRARLLEAGLCDTPYLAGGSNTSALAPCGTSAEWLAAAGICLLIASRYSTHNSRRVAAAQAKQEAAAAEAAARQQLLRYEPLAVQEAAAAAAAEPGSGLASAWEGAGGDSEAVAALVHRWLGLRFVLGQASMFAAFISSDNLLTSFTAGMAMLLVTNAFCEQHLKRSLA